MLYKKINFSLLTAMLIIIVLSCLHAYVAPLVGEETRYATVAWRMFLEHNWFVPQIGGSAYLHKTPLLFWFLNLGWWINVNWPWQMILPIIFALLTVYYTQKLAEVLFPYKPSIFSLAPLILVAIPFFINNLGLLRFDMMLTLFNIMACYYLTRATSSRSQYWAFILANGLGLLAKGPVIYIFTIPEVLLFCVYFSNRPFHDAIKLLCGVALSAGAFIFWWGPIIYQGKSYLIHKMLFEQVVARATGSQGVVKPFWDYVPLLPCIFLPWILFIPFLRAGSNFEERGNDKKVVCFLVQVFFVCLIIFSLIKTKESRYILPTIPLVAIFIAYRLDKMTRMFFHQRFFISTFLMGILLCCSAIAVFILLNYFSQKIHIFYAAYFPNSVSYILFFIGLMMVVSARLPVKKQVTFLIWVSICVSATIDLGATSAISKTQDLNPAVKFINGLLVKNSPIISCETEVFDMQFSGRWPTWIPFVKEKKAIDAWALAHPNGWIITSEKKTDLNQAHAAFVEGCFEQTYQHLRSILKICPVSGLLVVPQDEVNIT